MKFQIASGNMKFLLIIFWWNLVVSFYKKFTLHLGRSYVFPVVVGKSSGYTFTVVSWLYDGEMFDMDWGWIINFFSNVDIIEEIKLIFSEFINDVFLSEGGALDRYGLMPMSEDKNLVHVCFK